MKLVDFQPAIFTTLQGEGALVGTLTTFVRLWGCDFSCSWCDTKDSWREGSTHTDWPVEEVAKEVASLPAKHVCITGGNPLVQGDDVMRLMRMLPDHLFTIETQGSIIHPAAHRVNHMLSLSPKLDRWEECSPLAIIPLSANEASFSHVQIKVVVSDHHEVESAVGRLLGIRAALIGRGYGDRPTFILQPEYSRGRAWLHKVFDILESLAEIDAEAGVVRIIPQMHKAAYSLP